MALSTELKINPKTDSLFTAIGAFGYHAERGLTIQETKALHRAILELEKILQEQLKHI